MVSADVRTDRERKKLRRALGQTLGSSPHVLSVSDSAVLSSMETRLSPMWLIETIARNNSDNDVSGVCVVDPRDYALQGSDAAITSVSAVESGVAIVGSAGDDSLTARVDARVAFVDSKKAPQVRWLIARLRADFIASSVTPTKPLLIVDFCGGRGGLALSVAREFPTARVVCIDSSPPAVAAGSRAAAETGCANLTFVCALLPLSAADSNALLGGVADIVLGLHACGGLTDAVLSYARDAGARAFLLVPCCATKNKLLWDDDTAAGAIIGDTATVRRLAESPDRDICERAMNILNNARLARMRDAGWSHLRLLTMPREISARNFVLCGKFAAPPPASKGASSASSMLEFLLACGAVPLAQYVADDTAWRGAAFIGGLSAAVTLWRGAGGVVVDGRRLTCILCAAGVALVYGAAAVFASTQRDVEAVVLALIAWLIASQCAQWLELGLSAAELAVAVPALVFSAADAVMQSALLLPFASDDNISDADVARALAGAASLCALSSATALAVGVRQWLSAGARTALIVAFAATAVSITCPRTAGGEQVVAWALRLLIDWHALFLAWVAALCALIFLPAGESREATVALRKVYHLVVAAAVAVPLAAYQSRDARGAVAAALAVGVFAFTLLEAFRALDGAPATVRAALHERVKRHADVREGKRAFLLPHLYLIAGVAAPLWLEGDDGAQQFVAHAAL